MALAGGNEVEIKVGGDTKEWERAQGKLKKGAGDLSKSFKIAGAALTGLGVIGVAAFSKMVNASREQAIGITRLDTALKNVGQTYEATAAAIEKVVEAQQRKTNFGDEQQRDALNKLITIGGKWEGSLEALVVAQDLAAGAGMDLNASALLVGKAIAGETSSLSRYGILLESGASQTEIMAALTKQFGGAAAAASDPIKQMGNRLGDVGQVFGDVLLPFVNQAAVFLERFARKITQLNPNIIKIAAIVGAAAAAFALIGGPILLLIGFLPMLAGGFALVSAAALPITLAIVGIAAAVAAGLVIWANWNTIVEKVGSIFKTVSSKLSELFRSKLGWILPGGIFIKGMLFIKDNWTNIWNGIRNTFSAVVDQIESLVNNWVNGFIKGINIIIGGINLFRRAIGKDAIDSVQEFDFSFSKAFENVKDTVGVVSGFVVEQSKNIASSVGDLVGSATEGLGGLTDVFSGLPDGIGGAKDAMEEFSESMDKATTAAIAFNAQTIVSGSTATPGVFTTTEGGGGTFSGIPGTGGIPSYRIWTELLKGFIAANPIYHRTKGALFMRQHQGAFGAVPNFVSDALSSQAFMDQFRQVHNFAQGGVVPGPKGQAQVAVVHGGETVIPANRAGGISLHFHGPVYGFNDFQNVVGQAMRDLFARGGTVQGVPT